MVEKKNKIQIRAEVFGVINYITSSFDKADVPLNEVVKKVEDIDDKDFLSRLLIKEFISTNDTKRASVISFLLMKCIPVDVLEKNLWSNLALKTVSDEKKYQLVEILKSMGKFIEYDKYLDYFEEPQVVIDADTKKMLMSAMLNPEAQIDFLDFMETLSVEDKILLINSMIEDYSKDDLANITAPIILYEKNKEILELVLKELIESKSALAYYPITRFCKLTQDEELLKLAQKGLKELQLAGINEEKAKEFFENKFSDTMLYNCYASMLDGNGNQGIMFSRIRADNSIQMFCVVINDLKGIVDCFGFNNMSDTEFSMLLQKFGGRNQAFVITFESGLLWLNEAEQISISKNYNIPYEYACWKEILFDVQEYDWQSEDIFHWALNILPSKPCNLEALYSTGYLDKLFFTKDTNPKFMEFVNKLDNELLQNDSFNIADIEKKIEASVNDIFDEDTKRLFVRRLYKIAFILVANSNGATASEIYELTKNKELLNKFFIEVIKKSIFVYYEDEYKARINVDTDNVFIKKSRKPDSQLDNSKLQHFLEEILSEWGTDE